MAKSTPIPVRALYFPANTPHSGPGYRTLDNLRPHRDQNRPATHRINYFPALQQFFVEDLKDGKYGFVPLHCVEWWEPMDNPLACDE